MTSPSQVYLSGLPLSTWQDALQIAEGADLQSEADDSSDPLSRSRDSSYPTHGADEKITENISYWQKALWSVWWRGPSWPVHQLFSFDMMDMATSVWRDSYVSTTVTRKTFNNMYFECFNLLHPHLKPSCFCDVLNSLKRLVFLAIKVKTRHLQPRNRHLTYGKWYVQCRVTVWRRGTSV